VRENKIAEISNDLGQIDPATTDGGRDARGPSEASTNIKCLALAGIFHATVTAVVFALGHAKILPALFDSNGAARFASDSPIYLSDAAGLVNELKQTGISAWASAPFPLHTKLYSLVFAAFGPLVGFNILAAEREQIVWARYLYGSYPGTISNIDAEVQMESWGDVIRYLPRAAEIGLFAPFPGMWVAPGAMVGRSGRMISGFETLMVYVVMLLGLWGLWKQRDQLAIWFLATTAVLSVILLGLVTTNVGALYRMRYPFWMLLIIVGVDGASRLRFPER